MLSLLKKIIPKSVFNFFQPAYHYLLALTGAVLYRFPSKKLIVIGITGTKGKSTTTELVNSILEAASYKTAVQSTIRFKIGENEERNMYKMSMPGRFFMQQFLRRAVDNGCSHAVLELTSEGAKQFRHKFIALDALIFTNLAPEHIESHGSYENYIAAKIAIARELVNSPKRNPTIVVNADDKEAERFFSLNIKNKVPYSLSDAVNVETSGEGNSFQVGKMYVHSKLPGKFNLYNMLGAIACARSLGIPQDFIKKGLENVERVRGRAEKIENNMDIEIVVDYAHTPDSLKALYETYCPSTGSGQKHKLVCVFGNTGGGRDTWKRKVMAGIADEYCDEIILTNEDPYDEDPQAIVNEMREGIKNKPVEIIMDRRAAIARAIRLASLAQAASNQNNSVVLITGKGTDPFIMGANGSKISWDDATVVREELKKYAGTA
jgi:UDP-N-acetylmuramoyl-L-alanyl-D-glutamate--2,6-diaminopimelate ligase